MPRREQENADSKRRREIERDANEQLDHGVGNYVLGGMREVQAIKFNNILNRLVGGCSSVQRKAIEGPVEPAK